MASSKLVINVISFLILLTAVKCEIDSTNSSRSSPIKSSPTLTTNVNQLEAVLLDYMLDKLEHKNSYEIFSGIKIDSNYDGPEEHHAKNDAGDANNDLNEIISSNLTKSDIKMTNKIIDRIEKFAENHVINVNVPRAMESGRLFLFKGLKKLMWPLIIGVQIAKTILLALFLPSILGSFGKILGKGISGSSGAFTHQQEPIEDLDFKDNGYGDTDGYNANAEGYTYGDEATNKLATQMYDSNKNNNADTSNNPISRYGPGGQKVTYVNSANTYSKGTNTMTSMKKNDFKFFHDIPSSSLLLTNYDPFYSPLLSRLDSVFQQLGYGNNNKNEKCREKLICLMYSNPAKYAPYSNLVSAQLSRELNQLKKPVSDNPDILRFFKYMKAAKDGQDGVNCEEGFECSELKDSSNPVMINTYNDINKLVQARRFRKLNF